ncbi:hypothetical protein PG991_010656 [Apiospora marii]|uniref:Uncharacterized protein n=1 Tax=Apiospora marii TaxID=335849 RepID=A0ABR1RCB9_9PEZI
MKIELVAIASALFISCILAWDGPSERDCGEANLCLTSFVWCAPSGREGCYYPEGVYPVDGHSKATIIALVMEDVDHIISWRVQPNRRDMPVRVQWELGKGLTWEVNTTETQVKFNPRNILRALAPGLPDTGNATTARAAYNIYNSMGNIITVDQPDLAKPGKRLDYDMSSQFIVASYWTKDFLDAQNLIGHEDEYNKWKLGVGISVGLGIPILMASTAVATLVVAKRMGWRAGDTGATPPKT